MERFSRSFRLAKQSFRLLMLDKELMLLPVISGILILLICAAFVVPVLSAMDETTANEEDPFPVWAMLAFYVVTYTISFFFQAAVVAGATQRMEGQDPTLGSALGAASKRIGPIMMWGLVAGTVGLIIRSIQERSELVGRIIMGLIGVVWSLATFFMVPVLVLEDRPLTDSFKRSWALFKQTWGETMIGSGGLGLLGLLLGIPIALVVALFVSMDLVVPAVVIGVVGFASLAVFMSALQGVYMAALYRFATQGAAPQGMDQELLAGAFRPKR